MGGERRDDADGESQTDVGEDASDVVDSVPIRRGTVLGGRYAVEKIIGRGGSGVVVRAYDRDLNQFVAIKIVRPDLAGQRVWAERLAREVRLARQIHHPHVCRVFDFQQADGRVFLVMELAENGTLRDELRSGRLGERPLADRIADARAVAAALAAIHGAGIVHRDLSPQNLLRMGDGRLVLSDFGLATDASESTSVHGGTIAYMAPEVMRGDRSTVASDIWSLGALMYEIVFGDKPRWSEGVTPEILTPALGRKPTEEERAVLETCRACTAKDPRHRIATAAAAARLLTERRRWRLPHLRPLARPLAGAAALALVAAIAAGTMRARRERSIDHAAGTVESPLIVVTGEPADWTDTSTVLVETPDRIECTRLLPDQRTIRFVWGTPRRAEDIDVVTRKRVASPLVPAAYAEGCPDLSPDGKRLLFQGHAKDGRAFAYLSDSADGKKALAIVPTAEPTMSSEPTWMGDANTFSYDIDMGHVGVFSTVLRRVTVPSEMASRSYITFFRAPTTNGVLVSGVLASDETEITSIGLPWLKVTQRFRVSGFLMDVRADGDLLYAVDSEGARPPVVVEIDPRRPRARRVGCIHGQVVRSPIFVRDWLTFVSNRKNFRLAVRQRDGTFAELSGGQGIFDVNRCGNDLIVARELDGRSAVERIDRSGRLIQRLVEGKSEGAACTPDGQAWFLSQRAPTPSIKRCRDGECRVLAQHHAQGLSVSPDGTRLAFLTFVPSGPLVGWIPSEGGSMHEVADSETACTTGWASNQTLWVSRRRDGNIMWTEVDADTGKAIGRVVPGQHDCTDGNEDPLSPINPDLRVKRDRASQLRLLPRAHVNHP